MSVHEKQDYNYHSFCKAIATLLQSWKVSSNLSIPPLEISNCTFSDRSEHNVFHTPYPSGLQLDDKSQMQALNLNTSSPNEKKKLRTATTSSAQHNAIENSLAPYTRQKPSDDNHSTT